MIRAASPSDRVAVIRLLGEFHAAAGCSFPFDPARADQQLRRHMAPDSCALLHEGGIGHVDGLILATAFEHPFGAGRMAKETFWFVSPDARGRAGMELLAAYEAWALAQGCTSIGMTALAGNDVSAIYRRRGYVPAESHFVKVL